MRTLSSDAFTAAQKAMGDFLAKIVLTFTATARANGTPYIVGDRVRPAVANGRNYLCTTAGTSHTSEPVWPTTAGDTVTETGGLVWTDNGLVSQTYGVDTTNRILNLTHPEQEWSQTAQVLVANRDKNLTHLALEGYSGVISYGYHTTSDEYSATAPLTVIAGKGDSTPSELATSISLAGLFNLWGEQEATEAYTPDRINTDTVKTILDAIASHSMTCFGSYPIHTIVYETIAAGYDTDYDDSIINAFTPKDAFSVAKGESRLSAFKRALSYTKCKAKVTNDSGVATIHVFQPLITGTTYNYEYDDAYGDYHNFFDKSVRTRLVLPNKVIVMNHPDHTDTYTGNAVDNTSYSSLGDQYYIETNYLRCASDAECARIAAAQLQGYQIAAEKGHGIAPMNCGQEVMDYVKITDSRAGDTRIGNIGYLNRWYSAYPKEPTRFGFEFRFGSLLMPGLAGTMSPRQITVTPTTPDGRPSYTDLGNVVDYVDGRVNEIIELFNQFIEENYNPLVIAFNASRERADFTHLSVTERMQGPMGPNKYD